MPRTSITARIGPPAITPVPGGAARRTTLPAPQRPRPSWCKVRPSRSGTRTMLRFASSVALRMASGTSRALPLPKPARPFWSPTTTSAANPKFLPPLTVLATRLIPTSLSTNSLCSSSRSRRRPRPLPLSSAMVTLLELQSALAGGICQGFHPAMEQITAAVEDHVFNSGFLSSLSNRFTDFSSRFDGAGRFQTLTHISFQR
mmetsp:Transcript_7982/g.9606  ORF Transcript_7982/g.9606 Transcript_7982/m.9606 type:complete len:202 (-) Transcript_7982:254-859(-)